MSNTPNKPDESDKPNKPDKSGQAPDSPENTGSPNEESPAQTVEGVLEQASKLEPGEDAKQFIEAALDICKQLYQGGRAFEAIPVARTAYTLATKQSDIELECRTANSYGVMLCDTGDYAGAIKIHATALKLAQQSGDQSAIARAWNGLGGTFLYAASYGVAVEAFARAVKLLRRQKGSFPLYVAYINLALSYLQLLDSEAGLSAAKKALQTETPELVRANPLNAILLRRNYVRLLVLANRTRQAQPLVDDVIQLSQAHPSPRIQIAVLVTRGIYEVACGQTELGLTRLREALERARKHTAALRDTLISMVQAEEMAGRPDRAAYYLDQLVDTVYCEAVEEARKYIELSEFFDDDYQVALDMIDNQRRHLQSWRAPPPADWAILEHLATTAGLKRNGRAWHNARVGTLTRLLALESGYNPTLAMETGFAAELHDIGMLALPDALLAKYGVWSATERSLLAKHCQAGVEILTGHSHPRVLLALEIAKYHHESWDGSGYPQGLAGDNIPKSARLCAVADVFDAMLSKRSYREPLPVEQAIERLRALAGKRLDPQLVDCFLTSLKSGMIGLFVSTEMVEPPLPPLDDVKAIIDKLMRGEDL